MVFDQFFYENPIPCWIYAMDDLRFLAVNKSACSRYGYREEEMLGGMTILDLRPGDERKELRRLLANGCAIKKACWKHMTRYGQTFQVNIQSFDTKVNGRVCRFVMAIPLRSKSPESMQPAMVSMNG